MKGLVVKYPHLRDPRALPPYNTFGGRPPFPVTHPELWEGYAGTYDPWTILSGSTKLTQWICSNGHKYDGTFNAQSQKVNRLKSGLVKSVSNGCLICSNQKRIKRENGEKFVSDVPLFLTQWSEKNRLHPSKVPISANIRAWWRCKHGFEWCSLVSLRNPEPGIRKHSRGLVSSECPCERSPTASELLTSDEHLLSFWAPENDIKPECVSFKSVVKLRCPECAHEFSLTMRSFLNRKSPCQECRVKAAAIESVERGITRASKNHSTSPVKVARYCEKNGIVPRAKHFKEVIGTIAPHIGDLSGTEIWSILSHQGMLRTPARQRFIEAMKTRQLATEDIQRFVAGEKGTASEAILKGDEEGGAGAMEAIIHDSSEDGASDLLEAAAERQEETEPAVRALAIMRAGEALAQGVTDEEALEYLIRGRLGRLWSLYFEMEQDDLNRIL